MSFARHSSWIVIFVAVLACGTAWAEDKSASGKTDSPPAKNMYTGTTTISGGRLIEHPGGTFEGVIIGSNTVNPPAAINAGTLTIVGPKAVNPPATKTETTGAIIANGGYTVTIGPTFTTNDIESALADCANGGGTLIIGPTKVPKAANAPTITKTYTGTLTIAPKAVNSPFTNSNTATVIGGNMIYDTATLTITGPSQSQAAKQRKAAEPLPLSKVLDFLAAQDEKHDGQKQANRKRDDRSRLQGHCGSGRCRRL